MMQLDDKQLMHNSAANISTISLSDSPMENMYYERF